jgi:cytochrome c biogenesis protein CcmG, thiol:disulfide interchange protein DsbE
MMRLRTLAIVAMLVLGLTSLTVAADPKTGMPLASGEEKPATGDSKPPAGNAKTGMVDLKGLRLQDLNGDTVALDSYLGKGPLILDFWATWCKPCLASLPELNTLYTDLASRGLQVVGINEDGQRNAAKVKPFVKTNGFKFPTVLDLNREAQSRLNVAVLPTTLLLDSTGKVVHTSFGYRPGEIDVLRKKVESLLSSGN